MGYTKRCVYHFFLAVEPSLVAASVLLTERALSTFEISGPFIGITFCDFRKNTLVLN